MIARNRHFVIASLIGAGLVLAPATSDAASWWPWKRQDKTQVQPPPDETLIQTEPVDRLATAEAKIRELTGQVEELAFRLHQMEGQLQQLQAAGGGKARPSQPAVAAARPPAASESSAILVVPDQPDQIAVIAEGPGAPPAPLGTIAIDAPLAEATDQPIDLTAAARAAAPAAVATPAAGEVALRGSAKVASLGDPRSDYERAYNSILSGDYDLAEASFRQFISVYPGTEFAPDAQYWLGESLFARGQYREAADEFLAGYKAYPKSGKAADTLLKLGLSLAGLGERDAACSTYAEVLKKYPQASRALRQRVATEQAVASC